MTERLKDMAQVRAEIDRLDDQLVSLLADRLYAIRRASEIKDSPEEALVEWRVQQVLDRVRAKAEKVGFDAETAERIWRGMMAECIAFEERRLSARQV